MELHGEFSPDDLDWNGEEKLIKSLQVWHLQKHGTEPGRTTLQRYIKGWLGEYRRERSADN
jgi:hypothetical protein